MMGGPSNVVSVEMLLAWPLLIGILMLADMRHGRLPLFLSYSYIAGLAVLHWFGAFVHAMPWKPFLDSTDTIVGFGYTTLALACFVLGTAIVPRPKRETVHIARAIDAAAALKVAHRSAVVLLIAGALFWGIELTPLNGVPSVTSVISAGKQLLIAGICLKCWLAWQARKTTLILVWIGLSALLPVYTVMIGGFLGFGISFLLTILIFIGTFFRPRALLIAPAAAAIFAGLSLFVSYMEHRSAIRDSVWGEQSLETRMERLSTMVTSTEPFDYGNPTHLEAVDMRLNQNQLVGAAVAYVPTFIQFAGGQTIYFAVIALIPRAIWPNKPVTSGSMGTVSLYTGKVFAEGTSVGIGQVMEFYVNFGIVGVAIGFLLLGFAIRYVDMRAAIYLLDANWPRFVLWFVMGGATLQPIGQLLEITSSVAAAAVLGMALKPLFGVQNPLPRDRMARAAVERRSSLNADRPAENVR
jgi:hypothetical protein